MITHQGSVRSVTTIRQGSPAVVWSGNTLEVVNAADFDRTGGEFRIEDDETVYIYEGWTEGLEEGDPDVVTTVETAPAGLVYGEDGQIRVDLWPYVHDTVAEVLIPEATDDTLQVRVPHALKPLFTDGIREDHARESVTMQLEPSGWVMSDVLGEVTPNLAAVDEAVTDAVQRIEEAMENVAAVGRDVAANAVATEARHIAEDGWSPIITGIAETPPMVRADGSPVEAGDLYYQLTDEPEPSVVTIKQYGAGGWATHRVVAGSLYVPGSISGTLIEEGTLTTRQVVAEFFDFLEATGAKLISGEIISPSIETDLASDRGIKIIGDRLTGYGPTGQLQIAIGGPEGIIKGVALEGVSVTGTSEVVGAAIKTAGTGMRAELNQFGLGGRLQFIGNTGYQTAEIASLGDGETRLSMFDLQAGSRGNVRVDLRPSLGLRLFSEAGTERGRVTATGTQMQILTPANGAIQIGDTSSNGNDALYLRSKAMTIVDSNTAVVITAGSSITIGGADGVHTTVDGIEVARRDVRTLGEGITLVRTGRGRELFIDRTITVPTGAANIFLNLVGAIDRPPEGNARGSAYFGAGAEGQCYVTPGGTIGSVNSTGSAKTSLNAHVYWTV